MTGQEPQMDDSSASRSTAFVRSLERGLAVIRAFDEDNRRLTLSDVARITGLTRAAARRFLLTLVELGYVDDRGHYFSLRPRILELGYALVSSLQLPEVVKPHLERLSQRADESSSVAVLDGPDIVYVARVATRRIMNATIGIGTRFPAYATSMGRVLLAGHTNEWLAGYLASAQLRPLTARTVTAPEELMDILFEIRENGWALVDQELEDGIRSIAAPLHDLDGQVVAAVNVSAPARRGSLDDIKRDLLPPLLDTAREIESDLSAIA